jgi:hypothetical protein
MSLELEPYYYCVNFIMYDDSSFPIHPKLGDWLRRLRRCLSLCHPVNTILTGTPSPYSVLSSLRDLCTMRIGRFFYEGRMVSMWWMIRAWTVVICLWAIPSQAAVLDPWAFTSLGTLHASDTVHINTDTLALTGGAAYTGVLDPVSGAGIFTFDDITGTNLSIFGNRTLGLLSKGNIAFTGPIDLLGSGGLDMVAVGSMTLTTLNALGGGGTVSLTANQINLGGTVDSGIRPLGVRAVEPINLSGQILSGPIVTETRDISLSGKGGLNLTTGSGFTRNSVSLGSGIITLTGGTGSGSTNSGVITVSSTGEIVGSPGVTVTAPVPIPDAVLLFATGLVALGLVKRRIS